MPGNASSGGRINYFKKKKQPLEFNVHLITANFLNSPPKRYIIPPSLATMVRSLLTHLTRTIPRKSPFKNHLNPYTLTQKRNLNVIRYAPAEYPRGRKKVHEVDRKFVPRSDHKIQWENLKMKYIDTHTHLHSTLQQVKDVCRFSLHEAFLLFFFLPLRSEGIEFTNVTPGGGGGLFVRHSMMEQYQVSELTGSWRTTFRSSAPPWWMSWGMREI